MAKIQYDTSLKLIFFKHLHNGEWVLVPLYASVFNEDVWYVNLGKKDNVILLKNIPIDQENKSLLIDKNTGLLIVKGRSKIQLEVLWNTKYKMQLYNYKKNKEKEYIELVADYFTRLKELNERVAE